MKVENLLTHSIDLSTISGCKSFLEWVNGDISNAFYLGFMRKEFSEQIEQIANEEEGVELLKSIDAAAIKARPYLTQLSRLMEPYLNSNDGFVVLDMVNDVLNLVQMDNRADIYNVAYILGIYTDYLYSSQIEA